MIFFQPVIAVVAIHVLAAILPAVFLLRFIYRMDRIEKEPLPLLLNLLLQGVFAAFVAIVLETIGSLVLDIIISQDTAIYYIILAFLVVAGAEEGAKLFFLKLKTWRNQNFDFKFDGIVYAVFVSLGFAAFENIKYVFTYGLSVAWPRAVLAVPGHMGFAVFMGVFYGQAKLCENRGNMLGKKVNLVLAYVMPVLLHGFYDACAMIGSAIASLLFVLFVIVMYVIVYRLIKNNAAWDQSLY